MEIHSEILVETLKNSYNINSFVIEKVLKKTSIGKSYLIKTDNKRYFLSQSFNKNFIIENELILNDVCKQIKTPRILKTCRGTYFAENKNVYTYITEYLDVIDNNWGHICQKYFDFLSSVLNGVHSVNVNNFLNERYINIYKKIIVSKYMNPDFSNDYAKKYLYNNEKDKLEILEKFYKKNRNLISNRIEKNNSICLIYGDLNTSNIIDTKNGLYAIDLKSIQLGFDFEDIDVISMDLLIDKVFFKNWINFATKKYSIDLKTVLCGIFIRINSMINVFNKFEYKKEDLNYDYIPSRIDALYNLIMLMI